MQTLLTVIVTWLSVNSDLPAIYEHPRVAFISESEMAEVRSSRLASHPPGRDAAESEPRASTASGQAVYSIYDDLSRTIYLPEEWTAATPAEVSMLVHELVHHLQNVAGVKYACPAAREKPAYRAQARWLEAFGKSLTEEFQLDAMTILVRTNCMH